MKWQSEVPRRHVGLMYQGSMVQVDVAVASQRVGSSEVVVIICALERGREARMARRVEMLAELSRRMLEKSIKKVKHAGG
jgi:hypothetical protein